MNEIILTVGGTILLLLLSIIGFFLRQLYSSIKEMNKSLTGLHVEVKLLKQKFTTNGKDLIKLELRIDQNDAKIDKTEKDIIKLKSAQENCPARSEHKNKFS